MRWFSGEKERRQVAEQVIDSLIEELKDNPESLPLQEVLASTAQQFKKGDIATPFVLSHLAIASSQVIASNHISLTDNQAKKLKQLQELLNIRYGY